MDIFNPKAIEQKWSSFWQEHGVYEIDLKEAKKPFYNLMMYPYPSAEGLHVGNVYAFTGADIYGRFKSMQGYQVFEPIGFDSGGIHSENYAIKVGVHPKIQIPANVRHFSRQLKIIGAMYDWDHTVDAMDPAYYRWTQWIFIQLFKAGLAYKKEAPVTWCPSCKTTLSDEQTERKIKNQNSNIKMKIKNSKFDEINDKDEHILVCERCKTQIEKKNLSQWFFRITDFAERLVKNTYKLDWTEKVLIAQRNWIGKKEGAEIKFKTTGQNSKLLEIKVFTTRPDTLYGCTFLCLAPEFPQLNQLVKTKQKKAVDKYIKISKSGSEMEREAENKEKTGVFTGSYAINPVNKEKIPIYVADYVLFEYGSGAVMGVPMHDFRDYQFAKKYKLEIKNVVRPHVGAHRDAPDQCYEGEGVLVNSGPWDGWRYPQDLSKIMDYLEKKGWGKRKTAYKLRDWCISRQRYWGPPIPMIHCQKCDWQPAPEDQLPILLPDTDDYLPGEAGGKSPLARIKSFVETTCPSCGGPAERETDVSDTFLDSSWYFLAYPNTGTEEYKGKKIAESKKNNETSKPFNNFLTRKWLPVDQYTGGAEHSVLHLLYSRFITMALHDLGYLDFEEPFPHFYAHGLMIKDGAKMSKSRGNIVNPDEYIERYGADALRAYLMFMGPFDMGGDFRDAGIMGMYRFLRRVCQLSITTVGNSRKDISQKLRIALNKTIKKVGGDYQKFKYNTAIAALMTFVNVWQEELENSNSEVVKTLALIMAPLTPFLAEEMWSLTGSREQSAGSSQQGAVSREQSVKSVHLQKWPEFDKKLVSDELVTIVVQINGKVKEKLKIKNEKLKMKSEIIKIAEDAEKIRKFIEGKKIHKTIYVPGKLVNFVV